MFGKNIDAWEIGGQAYLTASLRAWALTLDPGCRIRLEKLNVRRTKKDHLKPEDIDVRYGIRYLEYRGRLEIAYNNGERTRTEWLDFTFTMFEGPGQYGCARTWWGFDEDAHLKFSLTHKASETSGAIVWLQLVQPDYDGLWTLEQIRDDAEELRTKLKELLEIAVTEPTTA
ncbi:MAG: hypothetical protein AB203_03215 [Parcubacteria bacterium C7867-008]|nr:MAG: hypothetical protein AB203_03215 [Parcubacteria bacterium C7867-008]